MPSRSVKPKWKSLSSAFPFLSNPNTARCSLAQTTRTLVVDGKGSLLLETVVAVMVFSMVGTAVIAGVGTAYRAGAKVEAQAVAENIARNQMESIFSQAYRAPGETPYPTISPPTGYGVSTAMEDVDPEDPDPDIEIVTVTVTMDGQDILVLNGLRFNDD